MNIKQEVDSMKGHIQEALDRIREREEEERRQEEAAKAAKKGKKGK